MTKNKALILFVIYFHLTIVSFAQDDKITIPTFDDKYSKYVAQLESGDLSIDYADFRNSFLDSKQYSCKGHNYDSRKLFEK